MFFFQGRTSTEYWSETGALNTVLAEEANSGIERIDGTIIMAGRPVAREIRQQCADEVQKLAARFRILPGLAVVRVGDDAPSVSYADRIIQAFSAAGLSANIVALPAHASRAMLQAELGRLNVLPEVAAILVQMPLPPHIGLDAVIEVLDPHKDVDGIHPENIGRLALGLETYVPATPAGGLAMLDFYGIPLAKKQALVLGRSGVVGKPFAQLLLARDATVTIAHSQTQNLPDLISRADIVATAVGKPGIVRVGMLKEGASVLDFGAAMVDGVMTGDADYHECIGHVHAITPVPGGTGPVTNAMLLRNTITAIKRYMHAT